MTLTSLNHTPMTKDAAKNYQKNVRELNKDFDKIVRAIRRSDDDIKQKAKRGPVASSMKVVLEPGESLDSPLFKGVQASHAKRKSSGNV